MSVDVQLRFDSEAITQYSKANQEPAWFLEKRLAGLKAAGELALPALEKTKIDKWNTVDFDPFQTTAKVAAANELSDLVKAQIDVDSVKNLLVQKNASTVFQAVSDELKAQGVIFTTFADALQSHGDLVQKYLLNVIALDEHKLTALHTAVVNGGVFLYVPKNVEVDVPLQAVYEIAGDNALLAPHVLIVAEANSKVTYVDTYVSGEGKSMVANSLVEVYVGAGASVQVASVRSLSVDVHDYSFRRATVERDGKMEWILGEMNDGNTVANNTTILKGTASIAETKSISVGTGSQRQNLTSQVQHIGTHTESDMVSKAVMTDEAVSILNGITKIEKGAEKANGVQAENILMLSDKSRGDANPILLIDEDDVKAGHAASVGRFSEESIFYLMSRGISRQGAERLIILGFLEPVVAEIPVEEVKNRLRQALERKLG
ncbi:Fe-S cluster assembly protein SufD [Brevibacillus formosus]|uniref:Fe-S cluster assembly protein SufD n=1 Tax=Brevibacillus formosus TaxID=54913 RepID=A0A837KI79_9BACL|nr:MULTISPECIES: Fe-S cluster assembly protein SufD [Brevibacillus]KLH96845.1 Fe-S cluster assembly protein SufD [Brevibacillus formosus]MBG9942952.1 Fe-S cluster assembly protein SufD [Brevibacillus formosus]MBW5469366.1 Fe-S cluster assembly protein SufD [Brevibacillus formosus]MBY0086140.1 Fe-S cluster assembly protein SufD [Brevibacillus brevis]MCE0450123.1 Fe-S cluster assembly protein SufD [Brevibacillus sp. AF8]